MKNTSKTIAGKKITNKNTLGYGISKKQLDKIRLNIRNENIAYLKEHVLSLHHADIADIFEILSEEDRKLLAVCLDNSLPAEVLASLDEQVLSEILDNYKPGILGDLIGKLETLLSVVLIVMMAILLGGSINEIEPTNLVTANWIHWFAPFGVVLFSLNGLTAIPEMSDLLGDYRSDLRKAVMIGSAGIVLIYAVFALIVVGVAGGATSEAAINGLSLVVGKWALILGGIVVFFATFTSYLLVGVSLVESLIFDYKWKLIPAWLMTVGAPIIMFAIGARSFIEVLSVVGAFVLGTTGIMVALTYMKAKKDAWLPKRHFHYPVWPLYISCFVFIAGIIATIIELV